MYDCAVGVISDINVQILVHLQKQQQLGPHQCVGSQAALSLAGQMPYCVCLRSQESIKTSNTSVKIQKNMQSVD
jgi:hypothetical protein